MNLFFDLEFTGLHQATTLVSLGCIADNGISFYAEATDYDRSQVSPWIAENVIKNLQLHQYDNELPVIHYDINFSVLGSRRQIGKVFSDWVDQFDRVEMWGDCLAYDWVVFCELFPVINEDTAERLPRNIFYIPFDICTLFKVKDIDPDISREEFSGLRLSKHNALDDAKIIQACYERLISL